VPGRATVKEPKLVLDAEIEDIPLEGLVALTS
jgi:hypothetical protein